MKCHVIIDKRKWKRLSNKMTYWYDAILLILQKKVIGL